MPISLICVAELNKKETSGQKEKGIALGVLNSLEPSWISERDNAKGSCRVMYLAPWCEAIW